MQQRSVDPVEKKSLERLKSRVGNLKEESITESVRILVGKALQVTNEPKIFELVNRIGPLYGVRSRITHGNIVNLGQSPAELQEIVSKTLLAVMRHPSLLTESERGS